MIVMNVSREICVACIPLPLVGLQLHVCSFLKSSYRTGRNYDCDRLAQLPVRKQFSLSYTPVVAIANALRSHRL